MFDLSFSAFSLAEVSRMGNDLRNSNSISTSLQNFLRDSAFRSRANFLAFSASATLLALSAFLALLLHVGHAGLLDSVWTQFWIFLGAIFATCLLDRWSAESAICLQNFCNITCYITIALLALRTGFEKLV